MVVMATNKISGPEYGNEVDDGVYGCGVNKNMTRTRNSKNLDTKN